MNIKNTFPFIQQLDVMDCGPTCIQMVSQYFGRKPKIESVRELCGKSQQGVSLFGINKACEKLGFRTLPAKVDFDLLCNKAKLPCIIHWNEEHYVVVYNIKKKTICIADPGQGKIEISHDVFKRYWANSDNRGIVLFIEPTEVFHSQKNDVSTSKSYSKVSYYASQFKPYFTQIGIGVLLSALLSLISKLLKLPLNYFNNSNLGDTLQRVSDHQKIEDFLTSNAVSTIFSFFQLIVFSFILISYSISIFSVFIIGSAISIAWLLLFLNARKSLDYQTFIHQSSNPCLLMKEKIF